ncbi:MAG: Crp/Fnr family transcriptional regulator [Chitinispirillaceae bacterium]|nr:Crp/Fnr family transcriptional regulator [Chitinispirillaceae bacterium]
MTPIKKAVKAGQHLFRENDRSRELYIIQSGKIRIYRTAGGKEIELTTLEKGSVFGEMALIDGKPRSASARAVDDCSVIIIDAETFHEKIRGVPPWFMSIIRMTSHKIRQANRRLQNISGEHQGAHITMTLYLFFERFDKPGNGLVIQSTQHQLIQLLGVTYQTVTRTFDFLHINKFVEIRDDLIRPLDQKRLGLYCEFLRLLIRKQLEGLELPSSKVSALAEVLIKKYPQIIKQDSSSTSVEGDYFYHLLESNELNEDHADVIEILSGLGLCIVQRNPRGGSQRPMSDVTIRLNHNGWKRMYLLNMFNSLTPGC